MSNPQTKETPTTFTVLKSVIAAGYGIAVYMMGAAMSFSFRTERGLGNVLC